MVDRIDIDDLPTGPAADLEDLQALLGLCRSSTWPAMEKHLHKIWEAAEKRLMKFNEPQVDGYWKGVKSLTLDLVNLPKHLAAQLEGLEQRKSPVDRYDDTGSRFSPG